MPTYRAVSTFFPISFALGSSCQVEKWEKGETPIKSAPIPRNFSVHLAHFLHEPIKLCIIFGLAFSLNQVVNRLGGNCRHFSSVFFFCIQ